MICLQDSEVGGKRGYQRGIGQKMRVGYHTGIQSYLTCSISCLFPLQPSCDSHRCRHYSCHRVRDIDLVTTNDVQSLRVEFYPILK